MLDTIHSGMSAAACDCFHAEGTSIVFVLKGWNLGRNIALRGTGNLGLRLGR